MASNAEMNGLSIDELAGDRIKSELIKAVKKRLNSDNVEVCIEHGSKKGLKKTFRKTLKTFENLISSKFPFNCI